MRQGSLQAAAAHYSYFRGLFFIPLGMLFILAALANWEVGPLRDPWAFPVAVVAIGILCLPINRYYAVGVGLKVHHVIIWGGLLVVGALPVWNGADPSNIGLVLAGVALMASGVFDHRLFVRTFGPARSLHLENSDVGA